MEVVLALGIVAFAIITIVALFGSLNQRAAETMERRAAVGAMDSLKTFLRHQKDFPAVYQWAQGGPKELVFIRFRADANGAPKSTGGTQVRSVWLEKPVANKADYEAAREGRWMGARLKLSATLNPVPSLPATAALYTRASLIFDADLYSIPDPDIFPPNAAPVLSGAVAVRKP